MNRLFAVYMVVVGLALLGPHRPAFWIPLLTLHLGVAAVLALRPTAWGTRPGLLGAGLTLLPLLVMPAFYAELPTLNRAVWDGRYFDPVVIGWERALFGGEPARSLARAMPWPWLSEPLHAAYLSYYLIMYVPAIVVARRVGREAMRDVVFTLTLAFLAHYVFFVWFPVEGPRYRFAAPGGDIAEYPMYRLAHAALEAGSSRGAAFPSSHVGVSVAATVALARWLPRFAIGLGAVTVGLALGAVYGGFHYAVDAAVGAVYGLGLGYAAPAVHRWLAGEPAPGRSPAHTGPGSGP